MFSKELEQSIASLFDQAQEKNIQYITIEHLLLMILNDFDVSDSLQSLKVNKDKLKNDIEEYLKDTTILKNL
jgi:ATP-dependent Clp protease ATP-binding subunit ClpA